MENNKQIASFKREQQKREVNAALAYVNNEALKVDLKFYGSKQTEIKWSKGMDGESMSMLFQTKENFLECCEVFELAKKIYFAHPENKK